MYAYDLSQIKNPIVKEGKTKYKSRVQLDKIMKRLFYIHNKKPIIDLLNSLYGDAIGYDATITYLNKEIINESVHKLAVFVRNEADMLIKVDYQEKSYEYLLEFQTKAHERK